MRTRREILLKVHWGLNGVSLCTSRGRVKVGTVLQDLSVIRVDVWQIGLNRLRKFAYNFYVCINRRSPYGRLPPCSLTINLHSTFRLADEKHWPPLDSIPLPRFPDGK